MHLSLLLLHSHTMTADVAAPIELAKPLTSPYADLEIKIAATLTEIRTASTELREKGVDGYFSAISSSRGGTPPGENANHRSQEIEEAMAWLKESCVHSTFFSRIRDFNQ